MKRNVVVGGLFALLLAGCGLVPPIEVGDALGMGGKSTTVNLTAGSGATSIQSIGTIGGSTASFTFADDPNINVPLTPSSFNYTVAISGVSFGTGCTIPASVNISISNFKVVLSDAAFATPAQQPTATAGSLAFTVTKNGSNFTVSNLTGNDISFSNLGNVGTILKQGGTNTLTLSGSVSTNPDIGTCTMTINWGTGKGVIKL